jgi:hypothetical protein
VLLEDEPTPPTGTPDALGADSTTLRTMIRRWMTT